MLQHEWPWKQHATWKKPVTKDHRLWFYTYKIPRFDRSIEVENRLVVTMACYCCLAAHLRPTLCDPMDCSPPGSSVHVTSQARILEWVAISFSKGSSRPGIKPASPALAGGFITSWPPGKPCCCCCCSAASIVSDSVPTHRRQPTRLPHPWDSPGKNTGVGCHFLSVYYLCTYWNIMNQR